MGLLHFEQFLVVVRRLFEGRAPSVDDLFLPVAASSTVLVLKKVK